MQKFDIVGSIIITLFFMLVANIFNLSMFSCILLMIGCFLAMNYRTTLKGYWYSFADKFKRKPVKKEIKSSYYDMRIDE